MKPMDELLFEESVKYSEEHIWSRTVGGAVVMGISDYAQDQLGDIIFVELPEPGEHLRQEAIFGMVESAKTASELYMPISGTVTDINEKLEDSPELVNSAPFTEGWMIQIEPDDLAQTAILLSAGTYKETLSA